jgi:hypothetical protein
VAAGQQTPAGRGAPRFTQCSEFRRCEAERVAASAANGVGGVERYLCSGHEPINAGQRRTVVGFSR